MPRPQFTANEQYLINVVRSPGFGSQSNPYLWTYLICGGVLAAFSVYSDNLLMLLSAFIVVCGFRLYEEWYQAQWTTPWRSIIEKYEAALAEKAPETPIAP